MYTDPFYDDCIHTMEQLGRKDTERKESVLYYQYPLKRCCEQTSNSLSEINFFNLLLLYEDGSSAVRIICEVSLWTKGLLVFKCRL